MQSGPRFNPLDTPTIGHNLLEAILDRPAEPLGELAPFAGAGIYALYNTGDFAPYAVIANGNRNQSFNRPIYVGRAIPAGASTGMVLADEYKGNALYSRLTQHANSIRAVSNLRIEDFHCRYLVVDDVWIPLAESLLITRFSPLWNLQVKGLGNHDPGKGRRAGKRSRWDTLHPGRYWAGDFAARDETVEQISAEIVAHLDMSADLDSLSAETDNAENGSGSAQSG